MRQGQAEDVTLKLSARSLADLGLDLGDLKGLGLGFNLPMEEKENIAATTTVVMDTVKALEEERLRAMIESENKYEQMMAKHRERVLREKGGSDNEDERERRQAMAWIEMERG